ncbi:hypothetical protein NDU88_005182 [Pleurodeles waltl]|uniref:Uncharacterized protein n=1 Tax=Pleurodeles waltl TaxID=8319 RepID=A0AAV7VL94_PLEWA|nr:hypothetical protein NDU88_005182 [Pleurodeles waltl]
MKGRCRLVINKLEGLLHLKSEECSKLTEEKCKLLKDLNSLICKVASFEEIIQCADHRLEMYSTHVLHLEKRNQNLVCMIKKLRENSKKHRQRSMAKQSKSMVLMNELDEANPDGGGQNTKFECGDAIAVTRK